MPVGTPTARSSLPSPTRTIPNSFPPHSTPKRGIPANVNRAPTTRAVANRAAARAVAGRAIGTALPLLGLALAISELLQRRKQILSEAPEGLYIENGRLKGPGVLARIPASQADGVHKYEKRTNLDWATLNEAIPSIYELDIYSRRVDLPNHWSDWYKTIVIPPGETLPEPGISAPNPYPTVPPKPMPGTSPIPDPPGQINPHTSDPFGVPLTQPTPNPGARPSPRPRPRPSRPPVTSIAIEITPDGGVSIEPNPPNARPRKNVRERKTKSKQALAVLNWLMDKVTEGAEILEIFLENGHFPKIRRNGKLERDMTNREKLDWMLKHGLPEIDWDQLFVDLTYNYVEDKVFGYIHGLKDGYARAMREQSGRGFNHNSPWFI